jgi:hypothetical protein
MIRRVLSSPAVRQTQWMQRILALVFAATCSLLDALPAAAEDLTITYEVTVPKPHIVGPVNGIATLWVSGSKVRWFDRTYGDKIYEVATGRIIKIDHQNKTYEETTPQQREAELHGLRQMMARRQEQQTKIDQEASERDMGMGERERSTRAASQRERIEKLKKVVEELTQEEREVVLERLAVMRAELEKLMKEVEAKTEEVLAEMPEALRNNLGTPIPPRPVEYATTTQKGTGKREIATYPCEQYLISTTEIFADGSRKIGQEVDVWAASELEPLASLEIISQISLLPRGDMQSGLALGLVAWSYGENGKELGYSMQAVEIKNGALDASLFEVPAGYTKVKSFTAKYLDEWKKASEH